MSTCVRKCATRVSGHICIFLRPHQNIAIYLDLSLQKHMQEETWQDKGLHLPRQWHVVLNTMRGETLHNNIVGHQLRSDRLQSNIRWFLAQLNHQVCGVKPPQTDCSWVPGSQGTPSSVPQSKCGLLQRNCSVFLICWRTTTALWCSSRHFSHRFRDELNKIQF